MENALITFAELPVLGRKMKEQILEVLDVIREVTNLKLEETDERSKLEDIVDRNDPEH